MSNGNKWYPMVALRFFRYLLQDRKVSVNEFLIEEKERQNQGKRREVREKQHIEIYKKGRCQMAINGTQENERHNQGRTGEVTEKEDMKILKKGRCQMVIKGTQWGLRIFLNIYYWTQT
jgi:cytochrome b involved in lipid metabolism